MFTGIVEETGKVIEFRKQGGGARMLVECSSVLEGTTAGDSISVDGVCLTVEMVRGDSFSCFLSGETLEQTTFRSAAMGRVVNLERALSLGGRLGGHLVSGHVEGIGKVEKLRSAGEGKILTVSFPEGFSHNLVYKGAVAVDGISLTVARLERGRFDAALVPETIEKTTFRLKRQGDSVNLEPDLLMKYVRSVIKSIIDPDDEQGLTMRALIDSGFITG